MREGKCSREQAQEVLDVWGPLASQLGVWFIKAQLEDHAFQVCTLRTCLILDMLCCGPDSPVHSAFAHFCDVSCCVLVRLLGDLQLDVLTGMLSAGCYLQLSVRLAFVMHAGHPADPCL